MRLSGTLLLGLVAAVAAAPASAVRVTSTTDDFSVVWSHATGAGTTVLGRADFDVTALGPDTLDLTVTLHNTADAGAGPDYRGGWTSLGWAVAPELAAITGFVPGTAFDGFALSGIPSLGAVQFCFYSGNNCSGGGQGLLADGVSDRFSLRLVTGVPTATWTLDSFGAKFQTRGGAYEFYGSVESAARGPAALGVPEVPEPATLALFALGLAGAGQAARHRRLRRIRASTARA